MSRTIRYFKLMYIVAGILLSNEAICETVDQIQIAPRLSQSPETKEKVNQHATRNVQHSLTIGIRKAAISKRWYHRIQSFLWFPFRLFSVWALPNFFIERSTSLLCRTLIINSDCDLIYK